jgi:hypothetical protein
VNSSTEKIYRKVAGERANETILGVAGEYGYGLEKLRSQTIKQAQVSGEKESHIGPMESDMWGQTLNRKTLRYSLKGSREKAKLFPFSLCLRPLSFCYFSLLPRM